MTPSPFQGMSGSIGSGEQAIPVHHEAVESDINDIMNKHDEGLAPYMRRLEAKESLSPEESIDYHGKLSDKARDIAWSNGIRKAHKSRAVVGGGLLDRHKNLNARQKVNKVLGVTEEEEN